jgi:hypothetical protein
MQPRAQRVKGVITLSDPAGWEEGEVGSEEDSHRKVGPRRDPPYLRVKVGLFDPRERHPAAR